MRETLLDFDTGNSFLSGTQNSNNKWDYIKLKSFYQQIKESWVKKKNVEWKELQQN